MDNKYIEEIWLGGILFMMRQATRFFFQVLYISRYNITFSCMTINHKHRSRLIKESRIYILLHDNIIKHWSMTILLWLLSHILDWNIAPVNSILKWYLLFFVVSNHESLSVSQRDYHENDIRLKYNNQGKKSFCCLHFYWFT